MGVIRVEHNSNYTTMSNYHLRDSRLSLRAIGLMSKMLSFPDDWDYSIKGLAKVCKEGRDAINSALHELEEFGYLKREQQRDGGSFAACDYILYECPPSDSPCTDFPYTAKPFTVSPFTENPHQINKDINKDLNKETPKAPKGAASGSEKKERKQCKWKPERFEAFWRFYPPVNGERPAKGRAMSTWDKLRLDDKTIDTMARYLQKKVQSDQWQRGVGIPYASSFLNQRRWEDEQVEPSEDAGAGWAPDPEAY